MITSVSLHFDDGEGRLEITCNSPLGDRSLALNIDLMEEIASSAMHKRIALVERLVPIETTRVAAKRREEQR